MLWFSKTRKERIDELMRKSKLSREAAAAVIYAKDTARGKSLEGDEVPDFHNIMAKVASGELKIPANVKG